NEWNAPDVLMTFPDPRTAELFLVSDGGRLCDCTVVDGRQLAGRLRSGGWRRMIAVAPDLGVVRSVLAAEVAPERALFLTDATGTTWIDAELVPLMSLHGLARYAERARALLRSVRE